MTDREAKQILLENRPDRPQHTKNRLLQSAIDVAVVALDKSIAETEMTKTLLKQLDNEYANKEEAEE